MTYGETYAEGAACCLTEPYVRIRNDYSHHPAVIVMSLLGMSRFSHITACDVANAIKYYWRKMPGEAPRASLDATTYACAEKSGLYCRACRKVTHFEKSKNNYGDLDTHPDMLPWTLHEMCAECVIDAELHELHRIRAWRRAREIDHDLDEDRELREATAAAKKHRRRLERASYELLSEMGLLPALEA